MRLIFATANLSMPRDLAKGYAGVDIVGIHSTYGGLLQATIRADDSVVPGANPDVVVLSDDLHDVGDLEAGYTSETVIGRLRIAYPELRIVLVGKNARVDEKAISLGVEHFIEHDERAAAVNLAAMLHISAKSEVARIIAISGHQGGAGRTAVAQGVAEGLAEMVAVHTTRGGVLLWELDLEHPTLGFSQEVDLVGVDHGRRTIARLLNGPPVEGDEDIPRIRDSIVSRDKSHLSYDVLLAPHGIREVMALYQAYPELIDLRRRLDSILDVLSRYYQAIVIDLGVNLIGDPAASVALRAASSIVIVATPCAAGLRSIMTMRAIISDLHAEERSKLVINRARRDDNVYTRYIALQASGVFDTIATIADGANATGFSMLAGKIVGMER